MSPHLLLVHQRLKPVLVRAPFSVDSCVWSFMAGSTGRCLSGTQVTSVACASTHSVGLLSSPPFIGAKRGRSPQVQIRPQSRLWNTQMLLSGFFVRLPLLNLQPCPLSRLLQLLAQHRARRQAGQVLSNVDARLVQFQQLNLLPLLAGAKDDP